MNERMNTTYWGLFASIYYKFTTYFIRKYYIFTMSGVETAIAKGAWTEIENMQKLQEITNHYQNVSSSGGHRIILINKINHNMYV